MRPKEKRKILDLSSSSKMNRLTKSESRSKEILFSKAETAKMVRRKSK